MRLPYQRGIAHAIPLLAVMLITACSSAPPPDPAAVQPPQPPPRTVRDVALGATQRVRIASTFGPGTEEVPADVTVYEFRDHVAPAPAIRPSSAGAHWASARVRMCRSAPVLLGYPAWVLGDDEGRTAQQTRVLHRQFPQPAFPNTSRRAGCATGWVTWVVPGDLTAPSKITFEQTREVPGAWRLR
jgi:hypothetical protein